MTPPLSRYQRFCDNVVLPLADRVLGQHVYPRFKALLKLQWASEEEIADARARRLQELMQFSAAHVPFYREAVRGQGLTWQDILTPSDLPRLPILRREDLRERFADLRVPGYRGRLFPMKSSGSTGTQATVLLDRRCYDEVFATQLLFWSWGGFAMGQRHLQTGMSVERGLVKTLKDVVFRCTYTSGFDLTDARLEAVAAQIRRKGIQALFGYASSLYVIARYFESKAIRVPMTSIFTWGDSLFPHYRELIERVFGCRVKDCYGLGEGLQCAAQCEEHDALHEAMHGVILEIVDGDGRPCKEGQLGRVLVTRLEPGPMPLIRYDTGDVAYFVGGRCRCGRHLRRISRIQGRAADIVTTPAGDRLIVHFFTQLFEVLPQIAQFQVRQDTAEAIEVVYVAGPGFSPEVLAQVRDRILEECRFPLHVTFHRVSEIPLEKSNKRRFVISRVPF